MGVAAKITIDLLRSTEGTLGKDDPVCVVQFGATTTDSAIIVSVVCKIGKAAKPLKSSEKFASKQRAEDAGRKQEIRWSRDPAL